jgi:CDP-diacylglycerol--serine O-phosphatidyltransferase
MPQMKHVPNIITCLNLFSGCLSCIMTLEYHNYFGAFLFVVLAAVFDFLDGFSARLLKTFSPIGGELDSLADVVSFGLAPGFVVFSFLNTVSSETFFEASLFSYAAFLIPVFSALRLAKFNIDARQKDSFLGLPVPANALFWVSFINGIENSQLANAEHCFSIPHTQLFILVLIPAFCLLMVSELPLFSLKLKTCSWKNNRWAYLIIGVGILLTILFRFFGISLTVICYILLSVIKTKYPKANGNIK